MATKSMPWSNISQTYDGIVKALTENITPPKFPNNFSLEGKEFLANIFKQEPEKRLTATQLLNHEWFKKENEIKLEKNMNNDQMFINTGKLNSHEKKQSGLKVIESRKSQPVVLINILNSEENNQGDFSITVSNSEKDESEFDQEDFSNLIHQQNEAKQAIVNKQDKDEDQLVSQFNKRNSIIKEEEGNKKSNKSLIKHQATSDLKNNFFQNKKTYI